MDIPAASVLVIESHPLMREALCSAIADEEDLKIAGQAANGAEALELLASKQAEINPDIILFALGNPGLAEMETLKSLHRSQPDTAILVLTSSEVDGQEQSALIAGAQAALSKVEPRAELIEALRKLRTFKLDVQKSDFDNNLDHFLLRSEAPTL